MIGAELERPLKIWDCFGRAPLPRGQKAEVVPGIGQRVRITGPQFGRALELFSSQAKLLLF